MEDFGEYTPLDARRRTARPGTRMHNLYPRRYHCATCDYARASPHPLARFVALRVDRDRSAARQIVWGGDPTTDWGFDGLDSAIKQALSHGDVRESHAGAPTSAGTSRSSRAS